MGVLLVECERCRNRFAASERNPNLPVRCPRCGGLTPRRGLPGPSVPKKVEEKKPKLPNPVPADPVKPQEKPRRRETHETKAVPGAVTVKFQAKCPKCSTYFEIKPDAKEANCPKCGTPGNRQIGTLFGYSRIPWLELPVESRRKIFMLQKWNSTCEKMERTFRSLLSLMKNTGFSVAEIRRFESSWSWIVTESHTKRAEALKQLEA